MFFFYDITSGKSLVLGKSNGAILIRTMQLFRQFFENTPVQSKSQLNSLPQATSGIFLYVKLKKNKIHMF